jgi:hypothetical protein
MPYPGSDHFLIPDPDPNIFSSRILHEKWNAHFFLSSYAFRSKVLVLVIVKKIRDPRSEIGDPRSRIRKKFIPDPEGKKAPDPGSGSATLI